MAQYFFIHPQNPQLRLVREAVSIIRKGGVIAYPTDSSYALGCAIGNKEAMDRIRRIRRLGADHNFTLVCRDLSEISLFANMSNHNYRLVKRFTPGAYTFILAATKEVPRRLQHQKRKSIGLRIPDSAIVDSLVNELNEPIMSSSLILPGEMLPLNDPDTIREQLEHVIDLVIDGGFCDGQPTSVISLLDDDVQVLRQGKGNVEFFM